MSTELEVVSKAIADINKVSTGIADLRGQYGGVIYAVTTTKGMDEAKAARLAIREPRYEVERIRKAAKKPILDLGKKLDAEASRIESELLKLETPIDEQIKTEEVRKVMERRAIEEAEKARVQAIQDRIDRIRALPIQAAGKSAEQILLLRDKVEATVIDDDFAEFVQTAKTAHAAAIEALTGLHEAAVIQEAEASRIKAEREELARLRKEQEARDKIERERLAEERRAQEAEQREKQKVIDAENARVRDQQEVAAKIERDRLAAERAEFERQQAEARKVQEPPPVTRRGKETKTPTAVEIVDVLAKHYRARPDTIIDWLKAMDFSKVSQVA